MNNSQIEDLVKELPSPFKERIEFLINNPRLGNKPIGLRPYGGVVKPNCNGTSVFILGGEILVKAGVVDNVVSPCFAPKNVTEYFPGKIRPGYVRPALMKDALANKTTFFRKPNIDVLDLVTFWSGGELTHSMIAVSKDIGINQIGWGGIFGPIYIEDYRKTFLEEIKVYGVRR